MKREEEINIAMKESVTETIYSSGYGFTPQATDLLELAWVKGATWADSHPKDVYTDLNGETISIEEIERRYKQGVDYRKRKMIDKACDWLDKVNTDNYMDSGIFQMNELISDFRKAMKGK